MLYFAERNRAINYMRSYVYLHYYWIKRRLLLF